MAGSQIGTDKLFSIGIDTWGTDYGLLDRNGQLLGNTRCMRNADGLGMRLVYERISPEEVYEKTGIQTIYGNTLFQLYERLHINDAALEKADKMLMLPDLLAYFMTGLIQEEYTMASTSMIYNHSEKDWDRELVRRLNLPEHIFADIRFAAGECIPLRKAVGEEIGMKQLKYVPVGTHDTASAVAAVPLKKDEVFCSSGTWSLFGVESDSPVITEKSYRLKFSNEGTVDGRIRVLKNIMGMWIVQQCMEKWKNDGRGMSWDELVTEAEKAAPFRSIVNLDEPEFYNAGDMEKRIVDYCRKTGQPVPDTQGQTARCIYESIALRYKKTFDELEELTGKKLKALRIVGGGSQNRILNQMAADAIGRPVYAGPVEAASIGNILMQAVAAGELKDIHEIRRIVTDSFEIRTYEPKDTAQWDEAYARYLELLDNGEDE